MISMGQERDTDDELLAVPIDTAARLAGVSVRRVRYWDDTNLVHPSIKRHINQRTTVRLYSFGDLVELLAVAAMLRSPGVHLPQVRKVVAYLRHRGYRAPLQEIRYAVAGGEVFFQDEDGDWAGGRAPDQLVEHRVLPLDEIRLRILQASERPAEKAGQIIRRRKIAGFKPVFAGTRIPVQAVLGYLKRGYSDKQIIQAFPVLTPEDINAARRQAGVA
jgi:uncharacterized protein (DUF433 family)